MVCAGAAGEIMSFRVGDTVGEYNIVGVLGSGGIGRVFRVEHAITRRVEAMKILLEASDDACEQAQRFLREIQIQARLNHPNIAAVHNAFWAQERLVMVMELVEGESLERLLERGRISLMNAIQYARQALAALAYAHAHAVTHRDIKPANVMVTPEGVVKLTDFGLAKTPADPRLTRSGTPMGSVYYIPPEQVRGNVPVDARADVYSLGVVLYEMVTGRRPFESDSAYAIMQAHVNEAPKPPAEVEPSLPTALSEIILTALAKDPAKRFQSADAFRSALEATTGVGAPLHRRQWRRAAVLGGGVAAVLAGLMVISMERRAETPVEGRPPAADAHNSQGPSVTLPKGTPVQVRTTLGLSTNLHRAGRTFLTQLAVPLSSSGRIVADRGAELEGRILESDRGGRIRGRARLVVELTGLRTVSGTIAIATEPVEILARGPGAGRVLLRRGPSAVIASDTVLNFRLREPVSVAVAAILPSNASAVQR